MDIGKPIATIMMRMMILKEILHEMMFIGHSQMLIIQKNFNMTLNEYLLIRFIRSNHPKYRKYAIEWINNLTKEQLSYVKKEMIKSIII